MWFPLIFFLLGQGYLITADPIPSVDEPHNAFWWVKQVVLTDANNKTKWLREGLAENSTATTAWMKQALLNIRDTYWDIREAIRGVIFTRVKLVEDEYLWYVYQALDNIQTAESWETLKAGRNDTEKAIEWVRGALTNETQEILAWVKTVANDVSLGTFSSRGVILTAAMDIGNFTSKESETSSSDEEEVTTLWGKILRVKDEAMMIYPID